MRAYKYTGKGSVTTFHYKYKELKEFIAWGKEHGDNGWILVSRDNKSQMATYKGFGTIENPIKEMITISVVHHELFDGKWESNEEIIHPISSKDNLHSYRYTVLDFSKTKEA